MRRERGFILTLLIFIQITAFAQNTFDLTGHVMDENGIPLADVTVYLHELNLSGWSDQEGVFSFKGLKNGHYHLHLYRLGYAASHENLKIDGKSLHLDFKMRLSNVELRKVVVEESLLKTNQREQSQTVEMVGEDFLLKNGNSSFVKILEQIPGVNSINTGMGISKPVIRGLGFNRVIVAENGIKQEGQQWGGDHGLEIDQFAVERVEVIKGPASMLYGSDGLGGIVSIRPARFPERNQFKAGVLSSVRSVNDFYSTSAFASINKNDLLFRVRLTAIEYGDYRVPADSFVYNTFILPIHNQRLKNTAGKERNAHVSLGINRNWGMSTLTFSMVDQESGLFAGSHGIPRAYNLIHDGDYRNISNPSQRVIHSKIMSNSSILIGKNWLEADIGYQDNHRREFSYPHAHGNGPTILGNTELEFRLKTLSANIRYHITISESKRLTIGGSGQIQENTIDGFGFLIPSFRNQSAGAFALLKQDISKSTVFNLGVRYDIASIQSDKHLQAVYSDPQTIAFWDLRSPQLNRLFHNFSGSSGISYSPSDAWNLKVNLGSGFRMPAVPELTANGIHHGSFRHEQGDSTLTPERGLQTDFSVRYEKKQIMLAFTPYFNYFNKFIFLDPTANFSSLPDGGLIYRFNQANAIHTGAEFQSDIHITKDLHLGWVGQIVYAYNLETNYYLPFIPPAQMRFEVEYEFDSICKAIPSLSIGANVQTVASQNRVARNELSTPGYNLLNMVAMTTFKVRNQEFKLVFSVQNIMNQPYFAHLNRYRLLNLPEPGRNYLLTLSLPLTGKLTS